MKFIKRLSNIISKSKLDYIFVIIGIFIIVIINIAYSIISNTNQIFLTWQGYMNDHMDIIYVMSWLMFVGGIINILYQYDKK